MSVAEKMMETQDRMLAGIEEAQGRMIEMNQRMAQRVVGLMPNNEMVKLPTLPGMDDVPDATQLIDTYFDFASKMADANRAFYKEMIAVWAPQEEVEAGTKTKTATKTATKAGTKPKARAKKAA